MYKHLLKFSSPAFTHKNYLLLREQPLLIAPTEYRITTREKYAPASFAVGFETLQRLDAEGRNLLIAMCRPDATEFNVAVKVTSDVS